MDRRALCRIPSEARVLYTVLGVAKISALLSSVQRFLEDTKSGNAGKSTMEIIHALALSFFFSLYRVPILNQCEVTWIRECMNIKVP